MKRIFVSIAMFILTFALAAPVSAATFEQSDTTYSLQSGEQVRDDLYLGAGSIVTSGEVQGDISGIAGSVLVTGSVTEDANFVGGSVDVLGAVQDDVRVIAGQTKIGGEVSEDVLVVGGMAHILPDANVGGDLVVFGGSVIVDGAVQGDVRAFGGSVALNGEIAGDTQVQANDSFTIGDGAMLQGDLAYTAKKEVQIPEGAEIAGTVDFTKLPFQGDEVPAGFLALLAVPFIGAFFFAKLVAVLVATLAAVLIFRRFSESVTRLSTERYARTLGIGLITMIVVPVAALIMLISIIGMFVGIAALAAYVLLLLLAKVYAGVVLGALLARWRKQEQLANWKWALLGVVLLEVIALLPIVGWVIALLIYLVALGAIALMTYRLLWTHNT